MEVLNIWMTVKPVKNHEAVRSQRCIFSVWFLPLWEIVGALEGDRKPLVAAYALKLMMHRRPTRSPLPPLFLH